MGRRLLGRKAPAWLQGPRCQISASWSALPYLHAPPQWPAGRQCEEGLLFLPRSSATPYALPAARGPLQRLLGRDSAMLCEERDASACAVRTPTMAAFMLPPGVTEQSLAVMLTICFVQFLPPASLPELYIPCLCLPFLS